MKLIKIESFLYLPKLNMIYCLRLNKNILNHLMHFYLMIIPHNKIKMFLVLLGITIIQLSLFIFLELLLDLYYLYSSHLLPIMFIKEGNSPNIKELKCILALMKKEDQNDIYIYIFKYI